MFHRRQQNLVAIATLVLCCGLTYKCYAQPVPPPERPVAPPEKLSVAREIRYVGPDTYILLDADGRPQPVLGMSYEEFMAAWKQLQHVETYNGNPHFIIEELGIVGEVRDDHAALDIKVTVRALVTGTIRVPLGLAGVVLHEQPRMKIVGDITAHPVKQDSSIDYDPPAGGFVATLESQRNDRHLLTFQVLVPLVRDGTQTSIRFNCPRALVSRLELAVPTPIVEASSTEGTLLTKTALAEGQTQLRVEGVAGEFRLNWNAAEAERPELATVLSATGALAISIDGHSIRSDAQLTVRSYGGSFDRFRVRLPPGAKLVHDRPRDSSTDLPVYRVTVDDKSATSDGTQIVIVEFTEKQFGPVEIMLSTEQPLGLAADERAVELAGFEVLGAVRQFGDVSIQATDDWQLRWQLGPHVRQVERGDLPSALGDVPATAAFQYDRQPWSLRAEAVSRPMVVHATPEYDMLIDTDAAQLRVRLVYLVPGARAFDFRVRLNGWELTPEPIESNGPVDRDRVLVTRDDVLVLPLTQASPRRAEVTFNLRRPLARSESIFTLPLPTPEADTVAAAELNVAAAAAIELLPDMTRSRGLSPTPVTGDDSSENSKDAGIGVQRFRYRSFVADAIYAAQRVIRPREVSVDLDTALSVDWQRLRATQEIAYQVDFQPLDEIIIEVPLGWSSVDGQLEIAPLTPGAASLVVATVLEPRVPGSETQLLHAILPQPRIGGFLVRLNYEVDEPAEMLGVGANEITLPQPARARAIAHRARVSTAPNIAASLGKSSNSAWQVVEESAGKLSLTLIASSGQVSLPLMLGPAVRDRQQSVNIQRTWLQTWQAGDLIQDRAAIRFRTAGASVTVELPPSVHVQEVEVITDGQLAQVSIRQEGRLTVELPNDEAAFQAHAKAHTLELRYRRPAPLGLVTQHEFTPPQLVGASALSEIYWQVVLPGERHIVRSPSQLVPVDPRQWFEVFMGRRPAKSQADMEAWVEATSQLAPAEAQNVYLFSGLSPSSSIKIITVPRWLIVLGASALVLALASAWIYVPAMQRGWVGVLGAAWVAGLALAYPGPAILLGQAAVVGLILAGLAVLLHYWLARSAPKPLAAGGSTNMRMRSPLRTDSYLTPSLGITGSGTPTVPIAVPEVDR